MLRTYSTWLDFNQKVPDSAAPPKVDEKPSHHPGCLGHPNVNKLVGDVGC